MNPIHLVRLTFMILASSIPILVGQEGGPDAYAPVLLPVSMQVDEEILPTTLYLELGARDIPKGLEKFEIEESGQAEQAFASLMKALSASDVAKAASFHRAVPFSQETGLDMATVYIDGFKDTWPSLELIRKYDLGSELAFAWHVNIEGANFRRVMRISKDPQALADGKFWLEDMGQGLTNLQSVIAEAEQSLQDGLAELSAPDQVGKLTYRQEAPGTAAFWNFNGLSTSFEAFDEKPKALPEHPAAQIFHQAMQALKSGDAQAYAKFFTPFSGQRFLEWQGQLPEGGYPQYVGDMQKEGRRVVFIMDADPAYLVFYETPDGRFPYQLIFKQGDGSLKLANFYIEGIFDNMIKDKDFFFFPVLKPLFGKGPEPPAPPTPQVAIDDPGAISGAGDNPSSTDPSPSSSPKDAAKPSTETTPGPSKWKPILIGILILLGVILILTLLKKFK